MSTSTQVHGDGTTDYVLDTGTDLGTAQMEYLRVLLDQPTTEVLDATGLGRGWRCLDLGAGGGSITRQLAERTGPTGRVVAVDLVTDKLDGLPGVEIHRHDVRQGLPDDGPFDLIHARLVLLHLPERLEVLRTLIDALAPGGWLVLGEYGERLPYALPAPGVDTQLFERVQDIGHHVVGAGAGQSLRWAHEADRHMTTAGMVDVHSREHSFTTAGGSVGCRYHHNLITQIEAPMLRAGVSEAELARYRDLLLDPRFRAWFYQFVCISGRKPGTVS